MVGDESRSGLAEGESLSSTQAAPCHPHSTLNTARDDTEQTILNDEAKKFLLKSMGGTAAVPDPNSLTSKAVQFSFDTKKFPEGMLAQDRLQAAQKAIQAAAESIKSELSRRSANANDVTWPQGDHSAGVDPSQVWRGIVPTGSTALPTVTSVPTTLATPMNNPAPSLDDGGGWSTPRFPTSVGYGFPSTANRSTANRLFDELIAPLLVEDPVLRDPESQYRTKVTSEDEEDANTFSPAGMWQWRADH